MNILEKLKEAKDKRLELECFIDMGNEFYIYEKGKDEQGDYIYKGFTFTFIDEILDIFDIKDSTEG